MPCQMFFLTMVQGSRAVGLGGKVREKVFAPPNSL